MSPVSSKRPIESDLCEEKENREVGRGKGRKEPPRFSFFHSIVLPSLLLSHIAQPNILLAVHIFCKQMFVNKYPRFIYEELYGPDFKIGGDSHHLFLLSVSWGIWGSDRLSALPKVTQQLMANRDKHRNEV